MISNKRFKASLQNKANNYRGKNKNKLSATSKYFGEIGSIPLEDIPYKDQLDIKLNAIKDILNDALSYTSESSYEIEASPEIYDYRFRMDYVCSFDPIHEPHNRFGQRKSKSFNWVVDMQSDILIPDNWFEKTRKVYEKARQLDIQNYDLVKHTGNLRYLVIRQQGDVAMLNIVTKDQSDIKPLMDFAKDTGFTSVNQIYQPSIGDSSEGEVVSNVGSENIVVLMSEFSFIVGPNNFFQNNILGFEKIINFITQYLSNTKPTEVLIDLYSGVGTLGIIFSKHFKKIIAVEMNPSSVNISKQNAKNNNIKNYTSIVSDISRGGVLEDLPKEQCVIVDPPRPGLEKSGLDDLINLSPKRIIYISCNPVTQVIDAITLRDNGYEIIHAKAFDLFPHTYHVENVVIFEKN